MVKINYSELHFGHNVVFNQEDTVFACCKENGSGRTRLFLAFGKESGRVYTRNGKTESWEILDAHDGDTVRNLIKHATEEGITIYQFSGTSETITGHAISTAG